MTGTDFVSYWIIFAVLVPVFSVVVFLLARKAGYLKDQDRLRCLALKAEVPEETDNKMEPQVPDKPGRTPCTRVSTRNHRVQADEHDKN